MEALQAHRVEQSTERLSVGQKYMNHSFVFAANNGEPLHERNILMRHFKPILLKAGMSAQFRLYDLRHTCATLLLVAGENPKVVAERLGHASVTLTLDTYSHVLPDMQKKAATKLETILFS
jgi:integrase